jgi:ankyrin repeat protein
MANSKRVSVRKRSTLSRSSINTKVRRAKKSTKKLQKKRTGGMESWGFLRKTLAEAIAADDKTAIGREIKNVKAEKINNLYQGRTVLIWAAYKNNTEAVKTLLDKGADVNKVDDDKRTALMLAVDNNNLKMVQDLLENGADVNIQDKNGSKPMEVAVIKNYLKMVQVLLDNSGVNINEVYILGNTALMLAVDNNNLEIVNALLDKGADVNMVNMVDYDKRTALMFAVDRLNFRAVWKEEIVDHKKKNSELINLGNKINLETALDDVEKKINLNINIIKALLEKGADVNMVDYKKRTALMKVARGYKGELDIVKALLDKGADVNKVDDEGKTALMLAAYEGTLNTVKTLLDKGADVNMVDHDKRTALMLAVGYTRKLDIVKALLDNGADVNKVDHEGKTALMTAAKYGDLEGVKALLDKRANVNIQDKYGKKAIDYAKTKEIKSTLLSPYDHIPPPSSLHR